MWFAMPWLSDMLQIGYHFSINYNFTISKTVLSHLQSIRWNHGNMFMEPHRNTLRLVSTYMYPQLLSLAELQEKQVTYLTYTVLNHKSKDTNALNNTVFLNSNSTVNGQCGKMPKFGVKNHKNHYFVKYVNKHCTQSTVDTFIHDDKIMREIC